MNILLLISHQPNPRFVKQLNYFSQFNNTSLAYFERSSLANINDSISKNVDQYRIGEILARGNYISRIKSYLDGFFRLYQVLANKNFEIAIVNNLDTLMLLILCKIFLMKKSKVIIEISDLREFVFQKTLKARLLQKVEKYLYTHFIDKLIVTSPKYYEFHFSKFYNGAVFVLENKPLSTNVPVRKQKEINNSDKVIIGIIGLLLRGEEYKALFEMFKEDKKVEIKIYGKGEYENLVKEYSSKYKNINYYGAYNFFEDAEHIYNSIDLIYIVYDTENGSMNNQLALPNKLYEAMHFSVPVICSKGTYLAERVKELKIGFSINFRNSTELFNIIEKYKNEETQLRKNFKGLNASEYIGDHDYVHLLNFLKNNGE